MIVFRNCAFFAFEAQIFYFSIIAAVSFFLAIMALEFRDWDSPEREEMIKSITGQKCAFFSSSIKMLMLCAPVKPPI